MTKETKIGLLVGLGVIIFIGILISDHLSVAQQQQPADLTVDNADAQQTQNTSAWGTPAPGNGNSTTGFGQRSVPLPPSSDEPLIAQADDPALTGGSNSGSLSRVGELTDFHPNVLHNDTGRDGIPPHVDADRSTTRVIDPVPPASQDKWYTIQSGDSLYKIAQKFYNDGSKYKTIFDVNKSRNIIHSPTDLRIGVRIVIPPVDGATTTVTTDDSTSAPIDVTPMHTDDPTAASGTYTIQKGDVLGVLAQKFYGTSKAWPKLVALNPKTIKDPDHLVVGTTIKVPKP